MNLTPEQIRNIIVYLVTLILSVAVHEFGHAFVASRLGDDTPRREGRVTLNPLAHADPIGTFLLPLVSAVYAASTGHSGGFGWGKPVMTRPSNYTRRVSMPTGMALVAVAGPLMNIVLALIVATLHVVLVKQGVIDPSHPINNALANAVLINFTLFFFNMLPIPPILDGGYILARFVPYKYRGVLDKLALYGVFILAAVMLISPLSIVFRAPAEFCYEHLYKLLISMFG
jgi:Zn-dependent protease